MNTAHSASVPPAHECPALNNARFTEILPYNRISEAKVLGFLPSFGKESDDEVATEQLTVVVDVTFVPDDNRKYPNSLDGHKIH